MDTFLHIWSFLFLQQTFDRIVPSIPAMTFFFLSDEVNIMSGDFGLGD